MDLSRPQMPAGVQPSAYGGGMYARQMDQYNQNQELSRQSELLKQQAMQQGLTQNQEAFSLAAPQRALAARAAEEGLRELDDPLAKEAKIAERIAKLDKAKKDQLEEKAHIFGALSQATPEEVSGLLQAFGDDARLGNRKLSEMTPQEAIALSKGIMNGLKLTPKYMEAEMKGRLKNEGFARTATINAQSRERVAAIQAQSRAAIAALNAASKEALAKLKPKDLENFIVTQMDELKAAGADPGEILDTVKPLMDQLEKIKRKPDAPNTGLGSLFGGATTSSAPASTPKSTPKSVNVGGKTYRVTKDNGDGTVMVDVNGTQRKVKIN